MIRISILTLCPEEFASFLKTPLIERNVASGILRIEIVDIRDCAPGSFRKIDDSPYGGGAGTILRVQPVEDALKAVCDRNSHIVITSPAGKPFKQKDAGRLAKMQHVVLLCGHYEGYDARIYEYGDEMLSIGDYVLSGGELPAVVIIQALMRLVDGSMKKESVMEESFEEGLLEYPQYTKPSDYKGKKVPEILLSGNHEAIREWRRKEALKQTETYRPDLLKKKEIDPALKNYIDENILPQYKDYEESHGLSHIKTVIENSLELCKDLEADIDMVYTVAAYHDIGLRYGREDHETHSGRWLQEDKKLRNWFTEEEIRTMKEAVEDHRASRKERPRSIYGCIVAEADRDVDPKRVICRCVQYETAHYPEADEGEILEKIIGHIKEKYGENGYLKLWLPCRKNREGLAVLRKWIITGEIVEICKEELQKQRKSS
ncbi:MAG: tRNA (guanosine(37)-N1)-methyltransferase TrmD [Erysipelotrichaceae bacterium]|nr:tRNA (guanosine(37)-N1)-methyltransferase TrmD [Erysipelotrichaceae bacterium]